MHCSDSQGRVHSQPSDQHSQRRNGCQLDAHQGHLQMINVSTALLSVSLRILTTQPGSDVDTISTDIRARHGVFGRDMMGKIGAYRVHRGGGLVETARRWLGAGAA